MSKILEVIEEQIKRIDKLLDQARALYDDAENNPNEQVRQAGRISVFANELIYWQKRKEEYK